jgi:hypothetical protein
VVESKHAEPPDGARASPAGRVRSAVTPKRLDAAAVAASIVRWDWPFGGFARNVSVFVCVPAAL